MATMQMVRKRFGGNICRRCLNRKYGLRLRPEDCRYDSYCPSVCPCCGTVQNIVTRLRFFKNLRFLLQ